MQLCCIYSDFLKNNTNSLNLYLMKLIFFLYKYNIMAMKKDQLCSSNRRRKQLNLKWIIHLMFLWLCDLMPNCVKCDNNGCAYWLVLLFDVFTKLWMTTWHAPQTKSTYLCNILVFILQKCKQFVVRCFHRLPSWLLMSYGNIDTTAEYAMTPNLKANNKINYWCWLLTKQVLSLVIRLPNDYIKHSFSPVTKPHWIKWGFFQLPIGSCRDTEEMMQAAYWPLSVVGRVLGGLFQQRDVDQSTGQNEEHCHSMSSPGKKDRVKGQRRGH